MKRSVLILILLIALCPVSFGQQDSTAKKTEPQVKQFWLAILKTGPKDKEITDTTQRKNYLQDISPIWNDCTKKES